MMESMRAQTKKLEVPISWKFLLGSFDTISFTILKDELHRRSSQIGVLSGDLAAAEIESGKRLASLEEWRKK